MVTTDARDQQVTIILQPNRSASWLQTKWLILAMAALVMTIALAWSLAGAWLILPFAGLEAGLLAFFLYRVCQRTYTQQIIHIDPETVRIGTQPHRNNTQWVFSTPNTHVRVIEAQHQYDAPALYITDEARTLRVGEFLNRQDCAMARQELSQAGLVICSDHWWRQTD